MSDLKNWAGNQNYTAARLHYPTSVEQIQELVTRSGKLNVPGKLKVLGSRHSFNRIADTEGDLISLKHLDRVVTLDLDRAHPMVTVEGGIAYGQLCRHLHAEGYALHNLASLPHISVAGACATATHGSGDNNGNLATAISAMEIVTADGNVTQFSREQHGELFEGMVVGLGGLGVVTKLTVDIVPAFDVRQEVYENLPLAQAKSDFKAITSSAYSVSLFTDWQSPQFNQVWFKRRVMDVTAFELSSGRYEATPATGPLHPLADLSAENCTEQMGVRGPWHERLPHFRMDHQPSSGEELQSEYFVAREDAIQAFDAIYGLREHVVPLLQISEVRTIAADRLWMSPCYGRQSVAIHFTWKKNVDAVTAVLPLIEEALAPYDARPHWGKLFTISPTELKRLYPRLLDFCQLLQQYDPQGRFRNAFLDTFIF